MTETPDPTPGNYYVSVVDGPRFNVLLGPFPEHATALAWVDRVRAHANKLNAKAHFYGFGTCKMATANPAMFNADFPEALQRTVRSRLPGRTNA